MVLRILYTLVGFGIGTALLSYESYDDILAVQYSGQILAFNASRLACIQGGNTWEVCNKIANDMYNTFPKMEE